MGSGRVLYRYPTRTLPVTIFSLILASGPYPRPYEGQYSVIYEVSQTGSKNGSRMGPRMAPE